jgi:molecular chaperone GrpE
MIDFRGSRLSFPDMNRAEDKDIDGESDQANQQSETSSEATEAGDAAPDSASDAGPSESPVSAEDFLNRLKIKDLEKKVADYESKIGDIREFVKKMEVETQETRSRLQRDQQRIVDQKLGQFYQSFLEVLDNLDLSIKSASKESGAFVEGVRMIHQQFHDLLKRSGLEKIETKGQPFDPSIHEAISMLPVDSDDADGKIVDELKSGYRFKENLIRPAQVLVGKKS